MSPGSRHPRLNTAQHRIWSFPTSRTAAKPRSVVDFQIQDTAHSCSRQNPDNNLTPKTNLTICGSASSCYCPSPDSRHSNNRTAQRRKKNSHCCRTAANLSVFWINGGKPKSRTQRTPWSIVMLRDSSGTLE